MIFPLQESCGVFRAFLEIRKTAELKSYITFLRIPWAISGRKMIRVNFVTLCQIFTMSRSPYRESLLRLSCAFIILFTFLPSSSSGILTGFLNSLTIMVSAVRVCDSLFN